MCIKYVTEKYEKLFFFLNFVIETEIWWSKIRTGPGSG